PPSVAQNSLRLPASRWSLQANSLVALLVKLVLPAREPRPGGDFSMRIVIVVPTGPPHHVERVAHIIPARRFDMPIGKDQVCAVIVPVCRTLSMAEARSSWVHVRVESNQGRIIDGGHFTKRDKLAGTP